MKGAAFLGGYLVPNFALAGYVLRTVGGYNDDRPGTDCGSITFGFHEAMTPEDEMAYHGIYGAYREPPMPANLAHSESAQLKVQ
jgi:hypothetical protein